MKWRYFWQRSKTEQPEGVGHHGDSAKDASRGHVPGRRKTAPGGRSRALERTARKGGSAESGHWQPLCRFPPGRGRGFGGSPLRHPRSQNFSLYQIISSGLQASYLSLHLQRSPCPHVSDSRHLIPLPPSPLPLKTAVLIFRLPFVPSEPLLNQLRTQTCSPTGPPELSSPTTSALLGPCSALSPPGA